MSDSDDTESGPDSCTDPLGGGMTDPHDALLDACAPGSVRPRIDKGPETNSPARLLLRREARNADALAEDEQEIGRRLRWTLSRLAGVINDVGGELVGLMSDPQEHNGYRRGAADLLGAIDDDALVPLLILAARDLGSGVIDKAASRRPSRFARHALAMLEHDQASHRLAAAQTFTVICDSRSVNPLLDKLAEDAAMRPTVCWALGNQGCPRALAPLTDVLRGDPDGFARGQAAVGLGFLGDGRAAEPLISAMWHDPVEDVREAALFAIRRLPGTQVDLLLADAPSARAELARRALTGRAGARGWSQRLNDRPHRIEGRVPLQMYVPPLSPTVGAE